MVRILVVDDDQKIVRLVRSYLEQAGYQVLTAFDGETALHTLRREKPDLVVLDLMLPDRDGWDITRIIRADATLAPTPVIMLTARVEDADKLTGLELGADDYITKPFNPREVVARVKAVLRRTSTGGAPPQLFQFDSLRIDLDRHEVLLDGQPLELTPTEFDLLKTLVEHPGQVFTRLKLIENALGYGYEGMERTIDAHIKNLRKKLQVSADSPIYIETVYGVGYRLRGEG
ncbi:MAG TPA: response regulator transcription factor [Anaerolineae bacterium]|nr:response regulator transcription factor [Anaerolineae bacterium]MCB9107041.1 response regulator transcription factor [Anaerolineales bacterium]HRV91659.1 response regulator transcription factor [Anaerolineae bacterium]